MVALHRRCRAGGRLSSVFAQPDVDGRRIQIRDETAWFANCWSCWSAARASAAFPGGGLSVVAVGHQHGGILAGPSAFTDLRRRAF